MADESQSKDLLERMGSARLPALPTERQPAEPQEPTERTEIVEQGRKPEDVVHARETPTETPLEPTETVLPAAPKPAKKGEAKKYAIRVKQDDGTYLTVEYTAAELEAKGLLDNLATTHGKHHQLQDKYNQLLEKVADGKAAPPAAPVEEQPAQPPALTNTHIAAAYDATADTIIKDLIDAKLMDEELPEVYQRSVRTMIGQMRFAFDKIFEQEAIQKKVIERLEATIAYLNKNKTTTESNAVQSEFNKQLDALVAKDGKLYGGLADPTVRANFQTFLVDEVQASVSQCTDEKKAQPFLSRQWVAYNAQPIMDAAKQAQKDKQQRQDKRFVTGEGGGGRGGVQDSGDKPMLDRMIDSSGRIRES